MEQGYNPSFLGDGLEVPLPRLTPKIAATALRNSNLREMIYLDYIHYSIVMNNNTRQLIFSAFNIDQSLFKQTTSKGNWKIDSRAGGENQLNNDHYRENDWDKGHMVMRHNTAWGNTLYEAQAADNDSYYYTNAAFQHLNMNRDEWVGLETDVVRKFSDDDNNKLCVFTGPIHGTLDRHYERYSHDSVRIPSGFFKVICYKAKEPVNGNYLGVKAFAMFQDEEILKDRRGRRSIRYKEYQVTIKELQDMTGLDFGEELFHMNPLFYFDTNERRDNFNVGVFPERIPIDHEGDLIDFHEIRLNQEHHESRNIAIISALVNPSGNERAKEWITILNRTTETIDLEGWKIIDQKNRVLELSGTIGSGETKNYKGDDLGAIILNNSGGSLRIIDLDPCLIDHVTWTALDFERSEGVSILFNI